MYLSIFSFYFHSKHSLFINHITYITYIIYITYITYKYIIYFTYNVIITYIIFILSYTSFTNFCLQIYTYIYAYSNLYILYTIYYIVFSINYMIYTIYSGRFEGPRLMGWSSWRHHWRQNLVTLTRNYNIMNQWQRFLPGWKWSGMTSVVSTITTNGNLFRCLFSRCTDCLGGKAWSCSLNWVESWQKKGKNSFCK